LPPLNPHSRTCPISQVLQNIINFWNNNKNTIFSDKPASTKKIFIQKLIQDLKPLTLRPKQQWKTPYIEEIRRKLDIINEQLSLEDIREKVYLPSTENTPKTPVDKETLINKLESLL
jgi:hypothetical protein